MYDISKTIKWHMGHRVPNHKSKCKSNHGHTYLCEVCLTANDVVNTSGLSDEGMVMDFSDIKKIMLEEIYDKLDHASMFYENDPLVPALEADEYTVLVKVPFIPTAENIARWCYNQIKPRIFDSYGLSLKIKYVKVWETPTSTALYMEEKKWKIQ